MGNKKKRQHPDLEELLERPWCYYCERDFDDLKILVQHQKAKHYKCSRCTRRLNTAGGLMVHMQQVHKEPLNEVENAMVGRKGLDVEVFGLEGIPEEAVNAHRQRIISQYYEQQAQRQAATGNPAPGTSNGPKKPKFSTDMGDLKAKLAAHKAKRLAEAANKSSGEDTPGQESQSPAAFAGSPPSYGQHPTPFPAAQDSPQPAFAQPFGQAHHQGGQIYQPPQPSFSPVPGQGFNPPQGYPAGQQPFPAYGQQFPTHAGQFPVPGAQQFGPSYQNGLPPFSTASPPVPYGLPHQQQHAMTAPANGAYPLPHQGNLSGPPGLPQRPNFGPQYHGSPAAVPGVASPLPTNAPPAVSATATSVDELISSASQAVGNATIAEAPADSKKKKDSKPIKLAYSNETVSPEEIMARQPRYQYNPKASHDQMDMQ